MLVSTCSPSEATWCLAKSHPSSERYKAKASPCHCSPRLEHAIRDQVRETRVMCFATLCAAQQTVLCPTSKRHRRLRPRRGSQHDARSSVHATRCPRRRTDFHMVSSSHISRNPAVLSTTAAWLLSTTRSASEGQPFALTPCHAKPSPYLHGVLRTRFTRSPNPCRRCQQTNSTTGASLTPALTHTHSTAHQGSSPTGRLEMPPSQLALPVQASFSPAHGFSPSVRQPQPCPAAAVPGRMVHSARPVP